MILTKSTKKNWASCLKIPDTSGLAKKTDYNTKNYKDWT